MEKKAKFKRVKKSLEGLSKSFEKHERIIKMAVTILAIVAALLVFGEKGKNDTILTTEASEGHIVESCLEEKDYYDEEKANTSTSDGSFPAKIQEQKYITVDISGQVINPGVYTLKEDGRLNDLIEMAGGLTEDADINRINRAGFLSDGIKIYIPSFEDSLSGVDIPSSEIVGSLSHEMDNFSSSNSHKININTATKNELETIPGFGPITAEKIIRYRETISKFQSIEDIMNVPGIGEKTFENIKDYISI